MSIEFATCSYFGYDIVNVVNEKTRPKNFTFKLTNVDHHGDNTTHRFADSVHVVSNSRGQNTRIGKELERMAGEVGGTEIVQSECKQCNMSDDNGTARWFAWSWHEVAKGMMPAIKSVLGLKDKEDEEKFLADLWHSLTTDDYGYTLFPESKFACDRK
ncbi:hypothetical protein RMATCC62417_17071 [Rhizopus microsporus]|nr:hypothetical protein RMATCC62417_17071 [Rhizopus microsporus]